MKPCGSSWVAQIAICTSLSFTERSMDADFLWNLRSGFQDSGLVGAAVGQCLGRMGHLILSIQDVPKLPYEPRHRILLPILEQTLKE
jgi:hypothetical protein